MTLYGLLGRKLGHSFSQRYFTEKFERAHINARYINFELEDIGQLMELLSEYPEIKGLNVTIPYKEQVIPLLQRIAPQAEAIGAVNTIKVTDSGDGSPLLEGYNTDIIGFTRSIEPLLRPCHKKALVLGTGGASKAVVQGLIDLGLRPTLVTRKIANDSDSAIIRVTYDQLTPEIMADHKVIVNATPLGMYPDINSCPDIPYHLITPEHLCYDLTYNPETTKFMRLSADHGATVKNGLEMLHLQAEAAWDIWTKTKN